LHTLGDRNVKTAGCQFGKTQKHTGPGFKKCRIIKNLSKCWYIENDGEKQDINLLPLPSNKIIKIPDIGPDPDQSHAEPRVMNFL
jgi:hypothetical protein